jgi:hypothetical protein
LGPRLFPKVVFSNLVLLKPFGYVRPIPAGGRMGVFWWGFGWQ